MGEARHHSARIWAPALGGGAGRGRSGAGAGSRRGDDSELRHLGGVLEVVLQAPLLEVQLLQPPKQLQAPFLYAVEKCQEKCQES